MAYIDNVTNILQIQPDGLPTFVRLSQNENGRNLYFQLAGNEIDIPANATITISGTKPDGTVYSGTGSISNNVILIPEMIQMTAVAGYWDAKVKIISGGNTIATGRIRFVIDADTVDPDSVPSDSELEGLVAEAQQYAETARTEAYGSPLTATTAAGMTDHTRVYVYTGSESGYTAGHWYFWNGSAWTDGGIYNSTAVNTDPTLTLEGVAADAKVVGDELDGLKEDFKQVDDELYSDILSYSQFVQGIRYAANAGVIVNTNNRCTMPYGIRAKKGDVITIASIPTGFRAGIVSLSKYESGWKTDSFTYTSNYDDTEFFVNVSTSDGTSQLTPSAFEMTVTKKDNTSRISELESYDLCEKFSINISDIIPWELGGITATSDGWSYRNSTTRVRTPENYNIHLLKNSTVQMTDYTDSRFYPSCRKEDGTYGNYGWITSGIFTVIDEGDYVFVLSNKTEVTQTSPNDLGDLMKIETSATLQYVYSHTNNVANKLKSDLNKLQPDGLHSPLLIPCAPKFIMHRGYSTLAPENTAPAFELAGQGGAWGIETDIHETTDGYFVCFHDNDVERMTDGTGNINEMTLAQVQALTIDAGSHIEDYTNEKIPTLEEYLAICRRYGSVAIIEWKYIQNVANFIGAIKSTGMEESCVILVGSVTSCNRIRQYTNAPCALLGFDGSDDETIINNASTGKNLWADIVSYRITDTTKPVLAHNKNIPLMVYTVNNTVTADTLFRLGVDVVATDSIPKFV